jgi:selenide, water dikinase
MHLVLAGGGHAHVEVLRRLAALPTREAKVTVISPEPSSPYSGMLPGLIAGHYTWDECHIPLAALCLRAGAELIQAAVVGIDPGKRLVLLDDGRTIDWDLLSVNTGAMPDADAVPGARAHAVPVKPVSGFLPLGRHSLRPTSATAASPSSGAALRGSRWRSRCTTG